MTAEEERWAEALLALRIHGDRASDWIAQRVAAVARTGDEAGVARLLEIAARVDQLSRGTVQ